MIFFYSKTQKPSPSVSSQKLIGGRELFTGKGVKIKLLLVTVLVHF